MFETIVVGTDGSQTAERAVDVAGDLGRLTGAAVYVVTAFRAVRSQCSRASARWGEPPPAWLGDDERVAAEEVVRRAWQRLAQTGVRATSIARLGEPADVLLAVA